MTTRDTINSGYEPRARKLTDAFSTPLYTLFSISRMIKRVMLALTCKQDINIVVENRGGMPRLNTRKLKELILYISEKSASDNKFGSTKLNKLVFFSDMLYYGNTGKSITGANYMKWEHGPVATCMKPILDEMKAEGELITRPVSTIVGVKQVPTAQKLPDLSLFSGEEIAAVDSVIRDFEPATNTGASQFSHDFIVNWKKLPLGHPIPLSAIIYPTESQLNEEDVNFFKSLLRDTSWGRKLQHERGGAA